MSEPSIQDVYELSPVQEGMLFHALLEPAAGVYFRQLVLPLAGPIDCPVFERAWQYVVDRHPVLRTSFHWEDLDKPLQLVHGEVRLAVTNHNWSGLAADQIPVAMERFLQEDASRPFDLSRAPLIRINLIRLDETRYYAVWSHHHIILDGWSGHLVTEEVRTAYAALLAGRTPELPPLRPYVDFIAWLQSQDISSAESYWREALRGVQAPTPLVVDHLSRSSYDQAGVHAAHERWLSAEVSEGLRSFARRHGLTLNTVVSGAWSVLLHRYTGEDDIVFGITVSGRSCNLEGVESMVGVFLNTLPLRVQIEPTAPLVSWLRRLQQRMGDLLAHEHTPVVGVQRWSEIGSGQPLFDSILVFENHPGTSQLASREGTATSGATPILERTNYPLSLCVLPGPELTLKLDYDLRRLDTPAVERLAEHLTNLLTAIAADEPAQVADLPLLDAAERHELVESFQGRAEAIPAVCLHDLVAAQAERTPDAIAVTGPGGSLSYADLERRANGLACQLHELGAGPDRIVGVALRRSVDLVVSLLAVLKAGAAYLPLDPADPLLRQQSMLDDGRAELLLTTPHDGGQLRHPQRLDPTQAAAQVPADAPPRSAAGPDSLAYAIFTSGSTGRPKAAANEHRAIVNRLCWMQRTYGLSATDRVLHKTPLTFDVSVWELFWPLTAGARLVVAPPGAHADPLALRQLIASEGVTTMHFVPSMLDQFLQIADRRDCQTLRRVICSGEALSLALQQRFFAQLNAELHNLYGPTEAAIDVTFHACSPQQVDGPVPIGRAIDNVYLYVLDGRLEPVPIGVPGELFIGGVAVGRGYLHQPELTAERFGTDPFHPAEAGRIYRTGDRVRWLSDGSLEYLGRLDHQVKIRGVRIELGEVEAALLDHPDVREAVVVARDDPSGGRALIGYVVSHGPQPPLEALRSLLLTRLPEVMVPTAFVPLDRLPLTPSGKVDRQALPAPSLQRPALQRPHVAPRTPIEQRLSELWGEVLEMDGIGVHDDFFALGGHSLLATRLASRVRASYSVPVELRPLFEAPTIAEQAELVESLLIEEIERLGNPDISSEQGEQTG
jgi:amino acid adenylation domain-containing protein